MPAVIDNQQLSEATTIGGSARPCRGFLRAHLSGVSLELFLSLQRVSMRDKKRETWAGPKWIAQQGICTQQWARKVLRKLVAAGWLEETDRNGRRAFRVLSHAEWSDKTGAACPCPEPKRKRSFAIGETEFRDRGNSATPNNLKSQAFQPAPLAPEVTEVNLEDPKLLRTTCTTFGTVREKLIQNIKTKIQKNGNSFSLFLAETEDLEVRNKIAQDFRGACAFIGFRIGIDDPTLSDDFAFALIDSFHDHESALGDGSLPVGIFCCKVIDSCRRDGGTYPPSFNDHRNLCRAADKAVA